jgi:hypothetical protein
MNGIRNEKTDTLSVMYIGPGCLQMRQISGKTFEDTIPMH